MNELEKRAEDRAEDRDARTSLLFGEKALAKIQGARILIAGLGGVGGAVLEGLARAGVRNLTLVDCDVFSRSNLNRQILSTVDNLGQPKVLAAVERVKKINPELKPKALELRLRPENIADLLSQDDYDLIIDCIDDLPAKAALLEKANNLGLNILLAGGAGNRRKAEGLRVDYLENAFNDPLLKALRRRLKNYPRERILTVFSPHPPIKNNSSIIASSPYLPNILGFTLAGVAVELILELGSEAESKKD